MREAVIVTTARTPIGKAYRGAFNNTEAPTLGGHAVRHAVERAGIDPAEVDDVVMGCATNSSDVAAAGCTVMAACCPVIAPSVTFTEWSPTVASTTLAGNTRMPRSPPTNG